MMPVLEDIIITKKHNLLDCFRLLNETGSHMLICLDEERFEGVITDYDIRNGILSGVKLEDDIEPIINPEPVVVREDVSKEAALALMKEKKIDALPVVDEKGHFVTLYTLSMLVESMALPNSAVIMAGGLGQRLMPLTKNVPKPLLKVGDKPIIEHVIGNISNHGVESFFVTINYKSDMVKEHLKDGTNLGVKIDYIEEKEQLGTVGAISLLKDKKIEFPFIVMNGDILTRTNFSKLLEHHKNSGNLMTVCLTRYQYDVPYGIVDVKDDNVMGISEKPIYNFFINAGIYCMSPELIEFIPSNTKYDINCLMGQLFEKKIPIGHFIVDGYWKDLGKPEDLFKANQDFMNGNFK